MLSSLFLSFRECLEAVLIIGIILTYLSQSDRTKLKPYVYFGAIAGLVISLIGGFISFNEAKELEEAGEEIFEGAIMLLASGLIAYFVVWMANQNRNISTSLKNTINNKSTGFGLFLLTFISVFREGLELVIFLLTEINEKASSLVLGSVLGLSLAIIVGFIIFKTSLKFNLKWIFKVLGIVLIFIGAELLGEGLMELIPHAGEIIEVIHFVLYTVLSLVLFLRDDFKSLITKKNNTYQK